MTKLALSLLAAASWAAAQNAGPVAAITRIQNLPNGNVRVNVSIEDGAGNPVTDLTDLRLVLSENGVEVYGQQLSSGRTAGSTVLVMDLSGSMRGRKLEAAKQAAEKWVDQAPSELAIAVIGFGTIVRFRSPFSTDKSSIRSNIAGLDVRRGQANTALNDAILEALGLLDGRSGAHDVLALTDGADTASHHDVEAVLKRAREVDARITTIGLGGDVRAAALQLLASTGGKYLPAAQAADLQDLFQTHANFLRSDYLIEYPSPRAADGSRRNLSARLEIRRLGGPPQSASGEGRYIAPRFIPDVKGNLAPYAFALLLLLMVPAILSTGSSFQTVHAVRGRQLSPLPADSKLIGMLDPSGLRFTAGQPVLLCPGDRCAKPHHIRTWRLQRCRCASDNTYAPVCYHRAFPAWLRRGLDAVSRGYCSATGRKWLCRCAGDPDGY